MRLKSKIAFASITAVFSCPAFAATVLPANTQVMVAPVEDITSKKMSEGDEKNFQIVNDVVENGVVVIPRGAPVKGKITWRTGRGIVGKSAKFEVTFTTVFVSGHEYPLKGKHRQEGKGNTVAALLGSVIISGHSAVMEQGQSVPALTAEAITTG